MTESDLSAAREVDLAAVELNYERFRQLAKNPNLSPHERIGFPDNYRQGYESAIFADILSKLPPLREHGKIVLDVGPGCAGLPRMLIDHCAERGQRLVLIDSSEMLGQLPDASHISKLAGLYPNLGCEIAPWDGRVDAFLCYSVLHYMYVDTNLFDVVDRTCELLAHGGYALFGDIPNVSKRKRFFSSPGGVRFHQEFMHTAVAPVVDYNRIERGKIDDAVLAGLIARAQLAGCDAYLLPQNAELPMFNRRDDLLIVKP